MPSIKRQKKTQKKIQKKIQNKTQKKTQNKQPGSNNNNNNKQNVKIKLNVIRNKYGGCLSFGGESKNVNKLFGFTSNNNNFNDISIINKIGKTSSNGFVYKIDYTKDDYNFSAVLKSSSSPESDNLFYEYFVGMNFINKVNLFFPCFVETYKLFFNTSPELYRKMKRNIPFHNDLLLRYMLPYRIDNLSSKIYCKKSQYLSILIQTVPNSQSLGDYINVNINVLLNEQKFNKMKQIEIEMTNKNKIIHEDTKNQKTWLEWLRWVKPSNELILIKKNYKTIVLNKVEMELIQFFYQVYTPLCYLKDKFTHYDLHQDNVLLYRLEDNKYITMRYIYPDQTVIEFNTSAIIKIIDYGRSFFVSNTSDRRGPVEFQETILSEQECNDGVQIEGDRSGFHYLTSDSSNSNYIEPLRNNPSHDLRLIKSIKDDFRARCVTSCFDDLFKSLLFENHYGTPSYQSKGDEIGDVTVVEVYLRKKIQNDNFKNIQTTIFSNPNFIKMGTLNIYLGKDKNMEYIPIL